MDNRSIVMLNRGQLQPHPDNPRKDLGDLTELRESIRENGIMQNLTVVPCGDGLVDSGDYMILIGHRRFAASDGILDELPCVIADNLSRKEQVGIMLEENMQRSDLTYIEQAHGFQMMLDLGDTVETISKKTGFSKATVKHRLAIAELDQEVLNDVKEWFQPTISDFIELEKVKDIEKRNEILQDSTCSKDLVGAVENYLEEEQMNENFEFYKKIFLEAGWVWEEKNQWFYYQEGFKHTDTAFDSLDLREKQLTIDEVRKLMEKIKGEVHFGRSYRALTVRKYKQPKDKADKDEKEKEEKRKAAQLKKNKAALKEIRSQICDAYLDFIVESDYTFKSEKEELSFIWCLMDVARDMSVTLYHLPDKVLYTTDLVSLKNYNKNENNPLTDFDNWTPAFQLMSNVYWSLASGYNSFEEYDGRPREKCLSVHRTFINLLKEIGFREREEWKTVLDGMSELYEKGGK